MCQVIIGSSWGNLASHLVIMIGSFVACSYIVHISYIVASYTLNTFLAQALYDSDASRSLLLSIKQNIAYVWVTFCVTNFALCWSQVTARSGTYRVSPTVACTWNYGMDCAASTTILIRWSVLCLTKLRIMFVTRYYLKFHRENLVIIRFLTLIDGTINFILGEGILGAKRGNRNENLLLVVSPAISVESN